MSDFVLISVYVWLHHVTIASIQSFCSVTLYKSPDKGCDSEVFVHTEQDRF